MPRLIYYDPAIRISQPKSLIVYLPAELRPFEFPKTKRPAAGEVDFFPPSAKPEELLTGFVHGKRASALEERLAMALDFFGMEYIFAFEVESAYSIPGEGRVIDFVVNDGGLWIPLEPGAEFVHASPSQMERDRTRQQILNEILPLLGIHPLGDPLYQIPFDRPLSFEDAKDIIADMFISI